MMEKHDCPAAGGTRPLGLYLHIPFCVRKCLYCDFLSGPAPQPLIDRYVRALEKQLEAEAAHYRAYEVRTVFFGGGTPSLLSAGQIGGLMEQIRRHYRLCAGAEITLESNPGTLDDGRLSGYLKAGINRLSMGLQSADDGELRLLGRIHTHADFLDNFAAAREAGFSNINVDLMSALPGQTVEGWLETLEQTVRLGPEHISAYSLIVEEGTPFWTAYGGKETVPEEEERRMYEQTGILLGRYGYRRYEISNYAKPGYACRHNIGYWRRTEYVGFGLGSASLADNVRWRVTDRYLTCMEAQNGEARGAAAAGEKGAGTQTGGRAAACAGGEEYAAAGAAGAFGWKEDVHRLSEAERMEEFLFLGLRMTEGVALSEFRRQFGTGLREVYGPVLERLEEQGLLVFYADGKKMKLTARGTDISNYVLAQFLLEEEA